MSCRHEISGLKCELAVFAHVCECDDAETATIWGKRITGIVSRITTWRGMRTSAPDVCKYRVRGHEVYDVSLEKDVLIVRVSSFDNIVGLCQSKEFLVLAVLCGPSPYPKLHPGYIYYEVYCRETYERLFTFYIACCEQQQRHDKYENVSMCFFPGTKKLAIVCRCIKSVVVTSLQGGASVRHIGDGVLENPSGVTCTRSGEIYVADARRFVVFNAEGKVLKTFEAGCNSTVAVHGTTAYVRHDGGPLETYESL